MACYLGHTIDDKSIKGRCIQKKGCGTASVRHRMALLPPFLPLCLPLYPVPILCLSQVSQILTYPCTKWSKGSTEWIATHFQIKPRKSVRGLYTYLLALENLTTSKYTVQIEHLDQCEILQKLSRVTINSEGVSCRLYNCSCFFFLKLMGTISSRTTEPGKEHTVIAMWSLSVHNLLRCLKPILT